MAIVSDSFRYFLRNWSFSNKCIIPKKSDGFDSNLGNNLNLFIIIIITSSDLINIILQKIKIRKPFSFNKAYIIFFKIPNNIPDAYMLYRYFPGPTVSLRDLIFLLNKPPLKVV